MATREEISMIGFEIIAYAGDAQCDLIEALKCAREGHTDQARQLHSNAKDNIIEAHNIQTRLLSDEAGGSTMDMTFIMSHAQDTLMTVMMLEKETEFMIDIYERIAKIEDKLG